MVSLKDSGMMSVMAVVSASKLPIYKATNLWIAIVWWSKAHTYKNAITNQLWLYVSASGFNRFHDQRFLDNANKVSASLH